MKRIHELNPVLQGRTSLGGCKRYVDREMVQEIYVFHIIGVSDIEAAFTVDSSGKIQNTFVVSEFNY